MAKKDLVQIIRDNPGCVAVIDNDGWWLYAKEGDEHPIASDGEVILLGDGGYGSGGGGGGADIMQALAVIVGVKIKSA